MALTQQAEAINVPNASYYRENLAAVREQFLQMRIGSHRSPGIFQQLYLCIGGLTWRLYGLNLRIETIKRQLEV
ncbi:hypothetical protein BJV77DRAFT_1063534 [Russula vinacea]|nr:hypothetical protein BJV77DRAFT_1063534 [Russula vinacea]